MGGPVAYFFGFFVRAAARTNFLPLTDSDSFCPAPRL
jgi:hypothetical protein